MKIFITIIFIAFFTTFQANAQSSVQVVNPTIKVELNIAELVKGDLDKDITAKKKDILNAKINSKIKGEVDLFFVADTSIMC